MGKTRRPKGQNCMSCVNDTKAEEEASQVGIEEFKWLTSGTWLKVSQQAAIVDSAIWFKDCKNLDCHVVALEKSPKY